MPLPFNREFARSIGGFVAVLSTLGALSVPSSAADVKEPKQLPAGWILEQDVAAPSYALTEPSSSDLNIDTLVLSCEQGPNRRGLQLRLYLAGDGPLALQNGAGNLKDEPTAELVVDDTRHPVQLLFADDFVLIADSADGTLPLLSNALVDSLRTGRRLELRFDLVKVVPGQAPAFSKAAVDLQAGAGGQAVAALQRCTQGLEPQIAQTDARGR